MADRFAESNDILIRSLKDNAKNKNIQQSTNSWINVWTDRILNCRRSVLTPEGKKKNKETNWQLFVWNFCTHIIHKKFC